MCEVTIDTKTAIRYNVKRLNAIKNIMKICNEIEVLSKKIEKSIHEENMFDFDIASHETEIKFQELVEYSDKLWIHCN